MSTRFTRDTFEKMTTHEFADLLSYAVMWLRRMPDIACGELSASLLPDTTLQEIAPVTPAQVATPKQVALVPVEMTLQEIAPATPAQVATPKTAAPVPADTTLQEIAPVTPPQVAAPKKAAPKKKAAKKKEPELIQTEISSAAPTTGATYTQAELRKKNMAQLKKLADGLFIIYPSSIKKDDLINKILAKQTQEYSEQFAIQNL